MRPPERSPGSSCALCHIGAAQAAEQIEPNASGWKTTPVPARPRGQDRSHDAELLLPQRPGRAWLPVDGS